MNFFYANGTPIINSLKVTSEVPLDPRLTVKNIAERDSLVTNHISYDRMKVYVKSNDTKYIYHKDTGEWEIDNKFSEEDKSKLDNVENYLIDTEFIYNPDNKLLYREHSYDPSTDITVLRDHILQEAKVTENGELYNGLLSKFYVNRLNNITGYLTNISFIKSSDTSNLYLTTHTYNPDNKLITRANINIPVATDDNNGLLSNVEHIKLGRIIDYMIEFGSYNNDTQGLKYIYKKYNPNSNATTNHNVIIPLVTPTLNGLLSSTDKIKIDDIETYIKSIALRQASGTEELGIDYVNTNPNTQTDTPGFFNLPLVTDTRNGLVSPARKHWMDNANGVSNTGTASDTWQLDKKDINTRLDPNGGVIIKDSGGIAEIRNNTDSAYSDLTLNNITIKGNVTQEGKSFITEAETVEVRDNTLLLNRGETGAGVSREFAGIEIDRGTEPKYQILFDESDDRFKVGKEGDLWCVTLRDDDANMIDGMFTSWDATTKRLKTTNIVPEDRELIFSGPKTVSLFYSDIYEGLALSKMGDGSFIAISPSSAEIKIDSRPDDMYYSGNIKADSFVRSTDKSPALHEADLVNDLTTGGATKPLTAEQGKLLKSSIDGLSTDLSKYALLAGNNTFSGSNTFALNKFQVGTSSLFRVNADASLIVDSIVTGGWTKELAYYSREASSSTAVKRGAFGVKADGATEPLDTDYLYLSVGKANWSSAQYKFQANKLIVPSTWSLRTPSDLNLIRVEDVNEIRFGSNSIPNYLVSNNTDITHRKYTATSTYTDYKIWDESNLPSPASKSDLSDYLPLSGGTLTGALTMNNRRNNIVVDVVGGAGGSWHTGAGALSVQVSNDDGQTPLMLARRSGAAIDTAVATERLFSMELLDTGQTFMICMSGSEALQLIRTSDKVGIGSLFGKRIATTDQIPSLSGYATQEWVTNKGYLTSSSLDGYAKTTDLASYLPLAGGTLTGDLVLSNNNYIKGILSTGSPIQILGLNSSNTISVGNGSYNLQLYTGASDISHWKGGTSYKIWDASNVSRPLDYVNGTAGSVTRVYTRNLNLNGTNYPFIGTGTTAITLFAPTTAGTSGQVLQSQGAGKAPIWVDGSTGGGVQLSDDNVWTGLNTFQGGLKTSDGTNSYDVWDNNSLKYPVKYAINSTGTGYALSFYSKTAGWKEIDTLTTKYLTSATVKSISAGGDGYIGIGTNAYASAAISEINTNSIYFRGLNNTVLSTNDDGELEYGSSSNYARFNSSNIRIAYPFVSSSGGGSGGTTDPSEGGLTISYYPVNTISRVTERAKIYCTTANLYLKDLAKNTRLDFDTDGLYVTTGSTSKVRLATLNDIRGGGSGVSLDGNNTWTGVNIFSGTGGITNQYDSGNTEIPATANYSIRLACSGSYNNYGFGAIRSEDRVKQSYAFVQTPSAFFTFDNSGSLYTTIGNTKYEFWNKQNLAKPIIYNTNSEGDAVLYKGDSASKIDRLVLPGTMPDDSTPNILQGGTGGFGSAEHAYASCHIGAVYTNEIHTYIDNNMTATVNLTMDDTGVYFAKSDGTLYKLTMELLQNL